MNIKNNEEILKDLSSNLPETYETNTPGFLIYDLLKSMSISFGNIYSEIEKLVEKVDVDNLVGEELNRYTRQRRGIVRKEATKAIVELTITGTGSINVGDIFSTEDDINFLSTEDKEIVGVGVINAQCEVFGVKGIVGVGSINQIPVTITGISKVNNESASYDGFEAESDNDLRERYYFDLRNAVTSNNINHFKQWASEVSGVGRSKVIPTWNGNNSVKVLIIDSDMKPASQNIVDSVQEYIDPIEPQKWGKGYGESALGSFCTVESAVGLDISIEAIIIKSGDITLEDAKKNIEASIGNQLKEIAFNDLINYVSYSKVVQSIMDSKGVVDAHTIKLNGSITDNVSVPLNSVAVLKTLVIGE